MPLCTVATQNTNNQFTDIHHNETQYKDILYFDIQHNDTC